MVVGRRSAVAVVVALSIAIPALQAQDDPYVRAMDLEYAGKYREAAGAFRAALPGANSVGAMLGLERSYAAIGWTDSVAPIIDSVVRARPGETTFRSIQLRTLHSLGRSAETREAFERWVRDFPRDAMPYREYSRMLIDAGRARGADSVLARAQRALGGTRDLHMEIAQTRAALGLWEQSARSWREAVRSAPYLERAAVFALAPTPDASRPAVRAALLAPPADPLPRRVLASLELGWGHPREAWTALRDLAPGDSVAAAWLAFAEQAEALDSWLIARDALVAAIGWRMKPDLATRAAEAALRGGDPESALSIADRAARVLEDSARVAGPITLVQVRALAALGRPADAARVGNAYATWLTPAQRDAVRREIAWAWVRSGDIVRARDALAVVGNDEEVEEVTGWLALYEGDLRTARGMLRAGATSADAVMAMALLTRTRVEHAPLVGRAFLELARGDTVAAAAAFEAAAASVPDAASLVLSVAARLRAGRGDQGAAVSLWQRIAERYPESPEAAEAYLDWARALRAGGDVRAAAQRLEHLIITYPQSALIPQARRELDLARRSIPPAAVR